MKKLFSLVIPFLVALIAFIPIHSFNVHGVVKDDKGQVIPFATVEEKGTKNSVSADKDGAFSIHVNSEKATLIISAVGYQVKEFKLNGRSEVNISLKVAESKLEEVVITAYETTRKRDLLSSVTLNKDQSVSINAYNYTHLGQADHFFPGDSTMDFSTEEYDRISENPFLNVANNPLSTFSIDVDAASYSNIRRFLNSGQLPPEGAVRIEEMINYFTYEYPEPKGDDPFAVSTEISDCPWNPNHKLALVGLQGKRIPFQNLPPSNLVFLIDVSGSMMTENKLPLVKASMKLLVDQLRQDDKCALVVYAGNAGVVLPSTNGSNKTKIKDAIDALEAGGSTAGGAGIKLAYTIAKENFIKNGNNRVILCTDGDFNVGVSSDDALEKLVEEERKSGVFLTVLGYGMGNYKDSKMQKLADKGNGNHAYIDGLNEAKKVLVNEFGGTLFAIAKDVKLQIEFNPVRVQGYRLIGYENRLLNKEDFNDDKKDAGELGSGHSVTALYEIIPSGITDTFLRKVDDLRYQKNIVDLSKVAANGETMNIKLRYKQPDGDISKILEHPVFDSRNNFSATSNNFRFAAAVAEFGMLLRNSEFKANSTFSNVLLVARNAKGKDEEGYRSEFISLVSSAQSIARKIRPGIKDDNKSKLLAGKH